MATRLTILNKILRKLRETEATTVADSAYTKLLGQFINDGMDEVSENHDWTSLNHEIVVSLTASTFEYDLTDTSEKSQLLFDNDERPVAFLFDDVNDTDTNGQMRLISEAKRYRNYQGDRSLENLEPIDFSLVMAADGDNWLIRLWPAPSASRTLRINFWTPQAELTLTSADDSTEIIIPNRPVELYAYGMALNERGEELGEPGNLAERNYLNALGAAKENDMHGRIRVNEYEMYRD